jgi:hypothetical protein
MPFEVTPSKQVIIDRSDVGPDDALRIVTDDVVLYCMIDPDDEHKRLRLIPGAVPKAILVVAAKAAREVIASVTSDKKFEEWHNDQPDQDDGLLAMITDRLLTTAIVRGGDHGHDNLNIGSSLVVNFSEHHVLPSRLSVRLRENRTWTAEGVVARISPARRFDAIVWNALHN